MSYGGLKERLDRPDALPHGKSLKTLINFLFNFLVEQYRSALAKASIMYVAN